MSAVLPPSCIDFVNRSRAEARSAADEGLSLQMPMALTYGMGGALRGDYVIISPAQSGHTPAAIVLGRRLRHFRLLQFYRGCSPQGRTSAVISGN
jgi:hypothetical protein